MRLRVRFGAEDFSRQLSCLFGIPRDGRGQAKWEQSDRLLVKRCGGGGAPSERRPRREKSKGDQATREREGYHKCVVMNGIKPATQAGYQERILRALLHIQAHLDSTLELGELAGVACFSPYHFHRVFRALTGEPVQEYVRRLRLERAANQLRLQNSPVTEVAFSAGYESHEAFTRAFHTMFNMSPSQFRTGRRADPESPSGTHFEDTAGYRTPGYGEPPAVEVVTLSPQSVLFLRHVGSYSQVGATWGRLCGWAGGRGLMGPSTKFLGISWDDPDVTPAEKLRYDAAIVIDRPVTPEGEFGMTELAGGDYATIRHRGPYETLSVSYQKLMGGWLPGSGRELRDAPCFEVYLNSPQTESPENLLTLIHVPIA
jgi:AraC family transcriptional regulator